MPRPFRRTVPATRSTAFAGLIAVLAAVVLVATGARPAMACSCPPPPAPGEAREQAEAVFTGRVTSIDEAPPELMVVLEVSEVWDGQVHEQQLLTTQSHTSMCGVPFAAGQEYLVYAGERDGFLTANLCSRTTPLPDASEDLAALGSGSAPLPGADPPDSAGFGPVAILVTVALMAGFVTVMWLLVRRRLPSV